MKAYLLLALLVGFAAVNLLLNYTVPSSFKLVLVPVIAVVAIVVVSKVVRRQQ